MKCRTYNRKKILIVFLSAALILAVLVIPIVECVKAIQRSMHKR